ncbi:MAG: hypothetical protein O9325_08275, partial [Roseomonas sp.]|nr:hypothetical protein [Roseomonas sp.]
LAPPQGRGRRLLPLEGQALVSLARIPEEPATRLASLGLGPIFSEAAPPDPAGLRQVGAVVPRDRAGAEEDRPWRR